jgi:hypothetical protein
MDDTAGAEEDMATASAAAGAASAGLRRPPHLRVGRQASADATVTPAAIDVSADASPALGVARLSSRPRRAAAGGASAAAAAAVAAAAAGDDDDFDEESSTIFVSNRGRGRHMAAAAATAAAPAPQPYKEAKTVDEDDAGITRCICGFEEESDFMIFCERCRTWQHGDCVGVLEKSVPENYVCYACYGSQSRRLKRHPRAPWSMRKVLPRNSASALRKMHLRPSGRGHKGPGYGKDKVGLCWEGSGSCGAV